MIKKLYTFGCSYTKDNFQKTWANLLAEDHGWELYNMAERGAGADFVVNRLLVANIDPKDSIVVILWPSADRFDLWADNTTPHLLKDMKHASWPNGIEPKLVDYYGIYNIHQGFILNGGVPRGYKHQFYKYFYSPQWTVHKWLVNIITAQLYLKSKKIKFAMSSAFPLINPIHYHHEQFNLIPEIYSQIDLSYFDQNSINTGFVPYCVQNSLSFIDPHHPDTQSHRKYIDNVLKFNVDNVLDK